MDDKLELRPRRRLTRAEAKEGTRRQLLAAAAQVFARKGFAGASLEEIAEVGGYTTGALYYHFASKEQIFLELLQTGWSRQTANRVEAVARVFDDPTVDPFDALARLVVRRAARATDLEPLQGEFWLYALRHAEGMAIVAEQLRAQVEGLEPTIAALMERLGTSPGIAPEEMTTVALALFQGLSRRRRIDPEAVPDDLFARVLRRLFDAPAAGDEERS